MIKSITKTLEESKQPIKSNKHEHYKVSYNGNDYEYWKDCVNDCWVFETFNKGLSDTSFESGCIDSIAYEIEQNL